MTTDPDVVMRPNIASEILVVGCVEGWFTGKKLGDYTTYQGMRRVVNGTDKASEIAEIAIDYEAALSKTDYGNKTVYSPSGKGFIEMIIELIKRLLK